MSQAAKSTAASTPFTQFTSPAHQAPKDFQRLGLLGELPRFDAEWNNNVAGWTEAAIIGDPWSNLNDAPRQNYYNPLVSGMGTGVTTVISWVPFPNRLITYLTNSNSASLPQLGRSLTMDEVMALADAGEITINGKKLLLYDPTGKGTLLQLPKLRCPDIDWTGPLGDFSPPGPRGWLDEYCEWSITYDPSGEMRSVMFTCENPAYYLTLWQVDPKAVLGLYQAYIDPNVAINDLYLRYEADTPTGKAGDVVMDTTTGRPAYNPVNKWNAGTVRIPGQSGGAMHLTSPPNTLSAEIYLAAAATIQRDIEIRNPQSLICCAEYGQNFRNSDPLIGFSANRASVGQLITLTDPVGLYIQQPQNFANWRGPQGQDVGQYWTITRGTAGTGPNGSDQILQAVFEIPASANFSINEVTINGQKITHVGVIAKQMQIALSATLMAPSGPLQPPMSCVADRTSGLQPWPVQMVPIDLFYGLSSTDLPAYLVRGSVTRYALIVQGADPNTTPQDARIEFADPGITVNVVAFLPDASAIPGQTNGGGTQGYILDVTVPVTTAPGRMQLRVLNPAEAANPSASDHPWESGLAVVV